MALHTVVVYIGCLFLIILTAIYLFFKQRYKYWTNLNVPFMPVYFIFGSVWDTFTKITMGEKLELWYKNLKSKGHKYFGGFFFFKPFIVVIDPTLVKNVLSKDFNYFIDRGFYYDEENDPLGAHLLSLKGLRWKHLRQKFTPTFTSGKLKMMFRTLIDCTNELETCLDESVFKQEPIDIKLFLIKYTTDVIGSCALGVQCNSFKNPDSEFIKMGSKTLEMDAVTKMKLITVILFPKIGRFLKLKLTDNTLDRFFRTLVQDTIEYRENNNVERNDFMQLLIQLKNNGHVEADGENPHEKYEVNNSTLTIDEAAAQAFLFFLAGFETSSSTMTFCLYELSKNQQIQNKTREEIVRVLKKHDGQFTYNSMMDMHYLERVILETLRKHPPLSVLQREVTKDYKIPDSDLVLKKGVTVFVPISAIQMDSNYYSQPDKFDPDRFTEQFSSTRPDFSYLPFGQGPRICIVHATHSNVLRLCFKICNYFKISTK